ncbi:2-hydroxyhepta-2,4-diene-1,7-dioate isomerase [Pollutimonas nitritireducens]|uniref:2-hydroxyhepta-2,4-diene-1,7-dioate isomerase n=1 Tax=Pollutimonas nitritireducens TaxID=2045209 RepID=A0A2N4UI16_9BURK|nr:fumarylacetoacetate hydrolase family protein [Pollutimonas nitritireducens]PLC54666.1 2-hydroxyhepta-2,4-diene-1,7-dioate isomerase [Pollutimonas nitritireducens]
MKLLRFGEKGREKAGAIHTDGSIRDISSFVSDIQAPELNAALLERLKGIDLASMPVVKAPVRIAEPVGGIRKFIAIGLNFYDHAKEVGAPIPEEPVIFMKASSCIQGPNDPVVIPRGASKVDWEAELGIVIGTRARYVPLDEALNYVAGYCIVNDVSERSYQMERGGTWDKGKGCDTFGPIGPWLVTADEIDDPQSLDVSLLVNGEAMQSGNTRTMIFDVKKIVSYVSEFMTLEPGDVITTGTPPGVGLGMTPPRFLQPGDVMTVSISGLGEQRQQVVAFER